MGFLRKLVDSEYKELKRFEKIANKIDDLSEEMEALSDDELRAKTDEFKKQLEDGATLEDILVPAEKKEITHIYEVYHDELGGNGQGEIYYQ